MRVDAFYALVIERLSDRMIDGSFLSIDSGTRVNASHSHDRLLRVSIHDGCNGYGMSDCVFDRF